MEDNQLIKLLENPGEVSAKERFYIQSKIEEYPYFQPLRMLLLKTFGKDIDHPVYIDTLEKAASYTTNREVLYNFVHERKKRKKKVKSIIKDNFDKVKGIAENVKSSFSINKVKLSFSDWLNPKDNLTQIVPVYEETKKYQDAIIDDFIKNPKKIATPIKEKSTEKNEYFKYTLVTETMAKLFVEQKKYTRAIETYEKLMQKNPEKISSFVLEIEKIKKLQANGRV